MLTLNINPTNPNPNPNPNPDLYPYPTLNQKPNHYPHSHSLSLEISSQEQLSPEQMSDHRWFCQRYSDHRDQLGLISPHCCISIMGNNQDKSCSTGWPRNNATTLIVNFMNIVDETELFFILFGRTFIFQQMTPWSLVLGRCLDCSAILVRQCNFSNLVLFRPTRP